MSEIVLVVVLVASKVVRKANEQAKIKIIVFLSDQVFIWQSSLEDDSVFFETLCSTMQVLKKISLLIRSLLTEKQLKE